MSYSKDREEFVHRMASMAWPLKTLRAVLRDAGICQRAAEVECSVSDDLIRASAQKSTEAAWKRLREAVHGFKGSWRVTFGGDPRGCVVTLHASGVEIGVPAQGYSASQMARMTGRA